MSVVPIRDRKEPPWTLGDRIRKVRRALGLEQSEFGLLLGVGNAAVSKWERDRGGPDDKLSTAAKITELARAHGLHWVSVGWLLDISIECYTHLLGNAQPALPLLTVVQ